MRRLDELQSLDRSRIHVFVVGPGYGEGIALALPRSGWILMDSCRVDVGLAGTDIPLIETVTRFQAVDDPVRWMVLTHPHEDHAVGFAEAIDKLEPERIGFTGLDPPSRSLLEEARSWIDANSTTTESIARRQVLAAFRRILGGGHPVVPLHAGVSLSGATDNATITARAPLPRALKTIIRSAGGDWNKLRSKANSLSLVFEVEFGDTRIVLGGDMITRPDRGTGWNKIIETRPELGSTSGLKIPHHGSREAQCSSLMNAAHTNAAWWVTPFSRAAGGPLPRAEEDMLPLCRAQSPIRLTVMPTREARQQAGDRRELTVADYGSCLSQSGRGTWLADAVEITPPRRWHRSIRCGPQRLTSTATSSSIGVATPQSASRNDQVSNNSRAALRCPGADHYARPAITALNAA